MVLDISGMLKGCKQVHGAEQRACAVHGSETEQDLKAVPPLASSAPVSLVCLVVEVHCLGTLLICLLGKSLL